MKHKGYEKQNRHDQQRQTSFISKSYSSITLELEEMPRKKCVYFNQRNVKNVATLKDMQMRRYRKKKPNFWTR